MPRPIPVPRFRAAGFSLRGFLPLDGLRMVFDPAHERESRSGRIHVSAHTVTALCHHARCDAPNECCGILIGDRTGAAARVWEVLSSRNIADGDKTARYQIDWADLFATIRKNRLNTQQIVGFYHSHTMGGTTPSQLDRECAWVGYSYMVIGPNPTGESDIQSWRIPCAGEPFEREHLLVDPSCEASL